MYQALDSTLQDQLLRVRHLGMDLALVGATAASAVSSQVNVPSLLVLGTESNMAAAVSADSAASSVTSFSSNTAGNFIGVVKLAGKDSVTAVIGCELYINGVAPTGVQPRCDAQLSASGNILLRLNSDIDISVAATSQLGIVVHYRISP